MAKAYRKFLTNGSINMQPTLKTERLSLRPFSPADAPEVMRLAGHRLIYETTASIPHPYPIEAAYEWISKQAEWFSEGKGVDFAITDKVSGELIGSINLFGISKIHRKAEMGYWIGVEHWNRGYGTEAAHEILKYGFKALFLNKVSARHVLTNEQSGKIMQKIGMQKAGVFRQDFFKDGKFTDLVIYEILLENYLK